MLEDHRVNNDSLAVMRQRIGEQEKALVTRAEIAATVTAKETAEARVLELSGAIGTFKGAVDNFAGEGDAIHADLEEAYAALVATIPTPTEPGEDDDDPGEGGGGEGGGTGDPDPGDGDLPTD